jgi:cellulose synthase/poly-beta-1,6-N-acetylglucosamine synthase-like glycosyltransferase
MQTLGAYYQCHKNAASFIRTIKSFKYFYPESDIVVVNDGGYNYKEFCQNNNIHYSYNAKIDTTNNALLFNNYETCIKFLENLFNSFKYIKESHILLLEDDVRVLRHHTNEFKYSVNGCNKNEKIDGVIKNILMNTGYTGPLYYGACGGCVIDKNFFQSIDFEEIKNLIYNIKDHKHLFASDILLSFITLYFGGTIDDYDEFAEVWYNDIEKRLIEKRVAFLHQYKEDYEKKGVFPNEYELLELKNYLQ